MFQNVSQLRRHGTQAADRNAEFAVVERSRPPGGMRYIEEGLLGVEGYNNVVAGRIAQIASQVVIVGFQCSQDLCTEEFRRLLAFIAQSEMTTFALREVRLDTLFALGFGQVLLNLGVRA